MYRSRVLAIATAVPAHGASQDQVCRYMQRVAAHSLARERGLSIDAPAVSRVRDLVARVHRASAIERRYSVLADYTRPPEEFTFFPRNWELDPFPTTATRMRVYRREAAALAATAARRGLDDAGVAAAEVSHLVVVSCTGFFAPGPDIELQRRLGLDDGIERTVIGFMGCYAAFNGLRAADAIVRADRAAVVLLVCVELCSLHYQRQARPEYIVANALFADGAAAAVIGASHRPAPAGGLDIVASLTTVVHGASGQMGWAIGDHGFEMTIGAEVPAVVAEVAPALVERLLVDGGGGRRPVAAWAVHPGGRKILDQVAPCLGLERARLAASYEVLREHGNMSSPTVLFVLDRLRRSLDRGARVVALGFGPGLTAESMLLEGA